MKTYLQKKTCILTKTIRKILSFICIVGLCLQIAAVDVHAQTISNGSGTMQITSDAGYVYISYEGAWRGYIHLFAPAGGTITDVKADSNGSFRHATYENLEVAYNLSVMIYPQKSMAITYKVTTAEGVTAVPGISMTPTLQEYR